MATPDAVEWSNRIRTDLAWLTSNIHPRINRCVHWMDPQTIFNERDRDRFIAPWARRIVRGLGFLDFLHRLPTLDAEYVGVSGDPESEDQSNQIEDLVNLIGDYAKLVRKLKLAHHTCFWSPAAFFKCGMPSLDIHRSNSLSEATPEFVETSDAFRSEFEPISEQMASALQLEAQLIPSLEGGFDTVQRDVLPAPRTSLDIPWVDWVDPRHIVTERGIRSLEFARYVGHLIVIPFEKFMSSRKYVNKDAVASYIALSTADGAGNSYLSPKQFLGANLLNVFDIPSAEKCVVLCEVWIREDPDHPDITHRVGTLDVLANVWVEEPQANKLSIFPFVSMIAAEESPGLWTGPSYIEQAAEDITEAADARRWLKKHMRSYHSHKWLMPLDGVEIDKKEYEKLIDPDYNGPVRYSGNRPFEIPPPPPPLPPAVVQYAQYIEASFVKNTGVTSTMQGMGSSNKVATAFRQEERFAEERRSEIRHKVYEMYRDTMLICTFLMRRYLLTPLEVRRSRTKFYFTRDHLDGIIGYTLNIVDMERGDPMQDRLIELQTIDKALSNPMIAAQFDPYELARIIRRVNRWPARVVRQPQGLPGVSEATAAGSAETANASGPAGQRLLGSRVDSGQETGDTGLAVAGASLRGR